MTMIGQGPQDSVGNPITVQASPIGTWLLAVLAAFCALALVRGYLGAATTAGRIGIVIFMGLCSVFFAWVAVILLIRRSTLEVSADAITYSSYTSAKSKAMGTRQLVLDRSSGDQLSVVRTGPQGRQRPGLTIAGTGTILPLNLFGANRVKQACLAKGWQFPS
jgi:hypothetical protein